MATLFPTNQAIVVGGGLAGVSAANTILEHGGKVVLLDKSAFCGGNSTKATSGINGAGTRMQKAKGIADSVDLFTSDTLKGGAKKPELVQVLCGHSGADVEWLAENFKLDLSMISRLGGHSAPRTHRGTERFPGMTITYALIQMLEKIAERTDKSRIITKAHVTALLTNRDGACVGCTYHKGGNEFQEHGPVILATGGFGADFTQQSLLAKYRPDLMHLPTTNGEHCTGDGIKMGEAIGARSIDLEWVQVHPTGLVKPDDPDAKTKFLAAEALRGCGGLVLDAYGKRFANELGRRDYLTGEMWKRKPPFRLVLNKAASDEIIWHCKHYTGRGVMQLFSDGDALAKDMGVPLSVLEETFEQHYQAAKKTEKDPEGGPWPAYPSGRSWDEASGPSGYGKKFYQNAIPGSAVRKEPVYVAVITPVIHYCMGGLEIDTSSACINLEGKPIPGLYAVGEVAGGVHGNNRLGGNSLLDCVVFGRVAGKHCANYILGKDMRSTSLIELSGGGVAGSREAPEAKAPAGVTKTATQANQAAAIAPSVGHRGDSFTMEEVARHNKKGDIWVVIDNQVLDVTHFLPNHPGGEMPILNFAGKDATDEFKMIHPPDVISRYAPEAVIGVVAGKGVQNGQGGVGDVPGASAAASGPPGAQTYTMEEIAKHNKKMDCWVAVNGQVLDVTSFLPHHPGGELAILTYAGRDATQEFNMIHPPDVIQKYSPESVIGAVAEQPAGGGALQPGGEQRGAAQRSGAHQDAGSAIANAQAWVARPERGGGWLRAIWVMAVCFLYEIFATIFTTTNIKLTNDRVGLTRSAIFLVFYVVIHALGNLHVFKGPDDFNGYGYFYVRLYWTGFGLPANIVEEYILLAALLHIAVGLKRTWDMRLPTVRTQGFSVLKLAISGLMLLVFMTVHLVQFRFGDTSRFGPYFVRPPPYLVNLGGIRSFNLFWTEDPAVKPVGVRDLYALEFSVFKNPLWCIFYIAGVCIFLYHYCVGWNKVVHVLGVPKNQIERVQTLGIAIGILMAAIYISFPLYVMSSRPFPGYEAKLQNPGRVGA